jgi:hypothetical protein
MNLSQISKKPELVEMFLDDKETVKEFGEPLSFWTWDRQSIDSYVKLANIASDSKNEKINVGEMIDLVKGLVFDENGKEIITDGNTLPFSIMTKLVEKVTQSLGK